MCETGDDTLNSEVILRYLNIFIRITTDVEWIERLTSPLLSVKPRTYHGL